jgi:hypothetical protein
MAAAPVVEDDDAGPESAPEAASEMAPAMTWHAGVPRQGEPDRVYQLGTWSVTADADGVIRPETPEDVQVVDAHRLPVIHQQTED